MVKVMYIESIELSNYRNYSNVKVEFGKNTNILYGDNAQGKTNRLESIYMAATTKSHRKNTPLKILRVHLPTSDKCAERPGCPRRNIRQKLFHVCRS